MTATTNRPLPLVGLDTLGSGDETEDITKTIRTAIRAGVRLFDCASLHGNEEEVGAALRAAIDAGEVSREELYVVAKLWCADAAPEDVETACRRTLDNLGLDYLDEYAMHWPVRMRPGSNALTFSLVHGAERAPIAQTYGAMERLVEGGLVRALGVSNMDARMLTELAADCAVKPRSLHVEAHPFLPQPELLGACGALGVRLVAHRPLGQEDGGAHTDLRLYPAVQAVALEANKSAAQVLLRWGVQRGASVVPRSAPTTALGVLDWQLSAEQMGRLDALARGLRFARVPWFDFDARPPLNVNVAPPGQPLLKAGEEDARGFYRNTFGRDGKPLHTEVVIRRGLLQRDALAAHAKHFLPEKCHGAPIHVLTDSVVDKIYGEQVVAGLRAAGLEVHKTAMPSDLADAAGEPSTEHHKTMAVLSACADEILCNGINKNSAIVSLGGGVVNNLAGVLAGMLYRGIALVHLPTTTMSTFDPALDFKQAVNHPLGKNLLGCYYPASTIAIDPDALSTLSERHILNGISEALKHGLTQSRELTDMIVDPLRAGRPLTDGQYLERICKAALEIKAPTLDAYEKTDYNEVCPQYGHAIGHAVEHLSWSGPLHRPLLHGEAVAIGMCVSAEIALRKGICTQAVVDEHYELIGATGLPAFVPRSMDADRLVRQMRFDKHTLKSPAMGLCAAIGGMATDAERGTYFFETSADELHAALQANAARRDLTEGCVQCAPEPARAPEATAGADAHAPPPAAASAAGTRPASPDPDAEASRPASPEPFDPSELPAVQLPPPLPFVRAADEAVLNKYRTEYAQYRKGGAWGSRGELTKLAKRAGTMKPAAPVASLVVGASA